MAEREPQGSGGAGRVKPRRIQLSRRKGSKLPPNTVVVSRPSKWGNAFRVERGQYVVDGDSRRRSYRVIDTANEELWEVCEVADERAAATIAVRCFTDSLEPETVGEIRRELGGKNLACWCPLDQPCHADALLELANEPRDLQQGRGDG